MISDHLRKNNHILFSILKKGKYIFSRIEFAIYKAILRAIWTSFRYKATDKNRILVTGDIGGMTGPFLFLRNVHDSLEEEYELVFSFTAKQITSELIDFCRIHRISLLKRPSVADSLDALLFAFVVRKMCPLFIIVNVPLFGKSVHLLSSRTPTIYYSHSIWHNAVAERAQWTFETFLDHRHKVVTVSQAAYDSLQAKYLSGLDLKGNLYWLYSWVPDKARIVRKSSKSSELLVILTLGTLTSYKNPLLWLRIAKEVLRRQTKKERRVEFWWAGEGPLRKISAEAAGDERIRFLGFVRDPEPLYNQASVYFQPSQFESFGLAICEAMMSGLPCVVTDCGGPAELVLHGVNGFVFKESEPDLIVEGLDGLISDENLRTEMGDRSRERYLDHFTEKHWRSGFNRIVEEITS